MLALLQVMVRACSGEGPLEVVEEVLLEAFLGVDRVVPEVFHPCERRWFHGHREVDDLGRVGAPGNFYGRRIVSEPLVWRLLAIIVGDADGFELFRVLVSVEARGERWKAVTVFLSILLLAPGVD